MTGPRSEDSGADDAAARDAMSEALTQAARRSAVGRVIPGQEPTGAALWAAVGGVRGIVATPNNWVRALLLYIVQNTHLNIQDSFPGMYTRGSM